MTINLFAPILRAPAQATLPRPKKAATHSHDFGRWVLGELVAARGDSVSWALQRSAADAGSKPGRSARSREAVWADTQPWCHE